MTAYGLGARELQTLTRPARHRQCPRQRGCPMEPLVARSGFAADGGPERCDEVDLGAPGGDGDDAGVDEFEPLEEASELCLGAQGEAVVDVGAFGGAL